MSTTASLSPPSPPPPIERPDFPTWLPAMLVKELRQGLRTRGFVGAFIVFQVIMVMLMLGTVVGSVFGTASTRGMMATTITGFFWTLLGAQLLLSTPARALGTLQLELDSRSLDLLVLTRLTAWRIVLGKWGSLMAQALLLAVAMLPYGIVRYFLGSVDLMEDAKISAALLGGCAVLTAAGLASSGMPKIVRIIVPIVLVFGFQTVRPLMMMMGGRGGSMSGPFGFSPGRFEAWVWWFNGALLLGIFLVAAVRRIAPPAENHVLPTRGLALLSLLPVVPLALMTRANAAQIQLTFAFVLLAAVSAVELSSMRWPMLPHWRPWTRGGAVARLVGRVALPGWPSAFLFALIGGVLVEIGVNLPNVTPAVDAMHVSWLVVLAVTALVFPALALSFFPRAGRSPGALYGLVLGISCLLALLAAMLGGSHALKQTLSVAAVLPGAGFWITLLAPEYLNDVVFTCQAVVVVAILVAAGWRSRVYWEYLSSLDARLRSKG